MGGDTTPTLSTVYTGGYGYRLKARLIMEEFNHAGPLMRLMLRLYPSINDTDIPSCGLQSAPFGGTATVSLAAVNLDRLPRMN